MTNEAERGAGDRRRGSARVAARGDAAKLGSMLARAFRDDPIHRWIFPTEEQWRWGSRRLFASVVRDLAPRSSAFTSPGLEGAALWFEPGRKSPGPRSWLESAAVILVSVGLRGRLVARGLGRLERRRPPERHWYLSVLGTDPDHQGKGVGSALLGPVLERCDREGVLAYLESSKRENIPFYERHGFVVTEEIRMPEGPSAWGMAREPRTSTSSR